MGYSRFDPAMQGRVAWNAGKTVGTKRALTQSKSGRYDFISIARGGLGIERF